MRYLVQDTKQGRTSKKMLLFGQGEFLYLTICVVNNGSKQNFAVGTLSVHEHIHVCTMTGLLINTPYYQLISGGYYFC